MDNSGSDPNTPNITNDCDANTGLSVYGFSDQLTPNNNDNISFNDIKIDLNTTFQAEDVEQTNQNYPEQSENNDTNNAKAEDTTVDKDDKEKKNSKTLSNQESFIHRKKSNERRSARRRAGRSRTRVRSRSRTPIRRQQNSNSSDISVRRVFIANIQFTVTWQDIKQLFQEKVGNVEFVTLFYEENGDPRGCGVVDFIDSESAAKAIEIMNKFNFRGRKIVVKSDLGMDRDLTGRIIPATTISTSSNETYGLSIEFLNSLNISPPLSDRVFVANLKYCVNERIIEDMFSMAGQIKKILLARDKAGKSRGFGTIQFGHPIEAVQAVSMFNQQMFYERLITVRMDRCDLNNNLNTTVPNTNGLPPGLGTIGKGLGVGGAPLQISCSQMSLSNMPPINNSRYGHPSKFTYENSSAELDVNYQQYSDYRSVKSAVRQTSTIYPPPPPPSIHQPSLPPTPTYSSPSASYNLTQQAQHQQYQQYQQLTASSSSVPYASYNQQTNLIHNGQNWR